MPSVRQSDAMNALRFLRTIHGWIGVLVIPWVLLYGLTGFYLNHERDMAFLFGSDEVDLLWREDQPGRLSDEAAARAWFAQVFPGLQVEKVTGEDYHGKPAFQIATGSLLVIAPKNSSFFPRTSPKDSDDHCPCSRFSLMRISSVATNRPVRLSRAMTLGASGAGNLRFFSLAGSVKEFRSTPLEVWT